MAEHRRTDWPPSGAPYPYRKAKQTYELIFSWLSWLAVLHVGAYAWRRQRGQGWQGHARWRPYSSWEINGDIQNCFIASFFDTAHPCYNQFTPVKTKYLLTNITWSVLKLIDVICFFEVDGLDHRFRAELFRSVLTHRPKIKLNNKFFLVYKCFSLLLFCVFWDYSNSKEKAKQYTNLTGKLQNSNQNFRLFWFSSGLWTTWSRSSALGLAKSIYINFLRWKNT